MPLPLPTRRYARDMDHIESSLRSRWHDGEFLDLQLLAKKTIDASTFRIETKLDVSSSFEGLVSASTGIRLEKTPGIIDTNIYIQVPESVGFFYFYS